MSNTSYTEWTVPFPRFNSAGLCRERGWTVGTVLEGTESAGDYSHTDRIVITAIGVRCILARHLPHDGENELGDEHSCTLEYRDWHEAARA
jgi:hypothetical protein